MLLLSRVFLLKGVSMDYAQVIQASFVRRINRFVAEADIDGHPVAVHVKNTGRCKELLVPGVTVFLEVSSNEARRYKYSLIAVEKNGLLVNIDSQAPNIVVYEAIMEGKIKELGNVHTLKREVSFGNSRFDLYFEGDGRRGFVEIKGVTLEHHGIAMFPDAPTARGRKHVLELMEALEAGYEGVILFLVQMKGCRYVTPHKEMDPLFAAAMQEAAAAGVQVMAYDARVTRTSIQIGKPLAVQFGTSVDKG